jgi:uncharacterized membrane protein YfcA
MQPPDLELWQWTLALTAALLAGVAKTGFNGAGTLTAALFAMVLPAKEASGVVLPLLIAADVVAVFLYRRHFEWRYFWRLLPWALAGIVAGYFAMGWFDDAAAKTVTGAIITVLTGLHVLKVHGSRFKVQGSEGEVQSSKFIFGPVMGLLAGFTTLVANAAGPLVTLYFLAMRLPKMEFVGTGAIFFMVVNWVKVPFMADLGLINGGSLQFNLLLLPAVFAGAALGRALLLRVNQRAFENIALVLGGAAGVKLLLF